MSKTDAQPELVPRLRFPEFREPWCEIQLQDVAEECAKRNGTDSSPMPIMGVTKVEGIVPMEERLVAADTARYKLVRKNWFAYNPMRLNIGSIARWQGDHDILVSPDYVVFRCLDDVSPSIDPDYLDHFRRSDQWDHFVTESGIGSVRIRIYFKDIGRLSLPLPSPAEQRKIAACLGSLDDLIAAEARKLAALREHKKGLTQQLFPREGETQPRLRFPEFLDAPDWKERALGELVEVATGQVDPTEPPFCDMPHVSSEHIIPNGGGLRELQSAKELGQTSGKYLFGPTDLLYSKIRPALNKVASPNIEGTCSADIYPIRVIADNLTRTYLFYLLLSDAFLQYAVKNSARSKIPKLNRETLLGFLASIPDPSEQQRIADCLATLDAMIAAQAEKLDALRTHKRGLMQQLFPSPEDTAA